MLALRTKNICRFFGSTKSILRSIKPPTSNNNDSGHIIVEPLTSRDLISVRGAEAKFFLQGLITNDIGQLDERQHFAAIYTFLLNKGGRVLYDAIIYRAPQQDTYMIECDRSISSELRRYLRLFRVRRKIEIDEVDTHELWVAYSAQKNIGITSLPHGIEAVPDPRLESLGSRLLRPKQESVENLSELISKAGIGVTVQATDEYNYQIHRYKLGIAEGVNELPPSKCFPLESNGDYLHGISFNKGCYVGQELTARTYHTGVVRKRLMPLNLTKPVTEIGSSIVTEDGSKLGVVRGSCNTHGLAVVNVDKALTAAALNINGEACSVIKPNWWPASLTDKRILADS